MKIWTIGHSTRSIDEFTAMLTAHNITVLCDVRRHPGSRTAPQYNVEPLAKALFANDIIYMPIAELGGRRKVQPGSKNTVWRNPSFQGYADYMETDGFQRGIDRLLALSQHGSVVIMCSEAVWWRCHRSMIADWLKAHGHTVIHIMSDRLAQDREHPYTSAARIINGQLSYRETQ